VPIVAVESLYNVAQRGSEPVLRYAESRGIAFVPWFPLGHGGLVGPDGPLARVAAELGVSAAQLALAWLLRRSPQTLPIPGTTSRAHLDDNLRAMDLILPDDVWRRIEDVCSRLPAGTLPDVPAPEGAAR